MNYPRVCPKHPDPDWVVLFNLFLLSRLHPLAQHLRYRRWRTLAMMNSFKSSSLKSCLYMSGHGEAMCSNFFGTQEVKATGILWQRPKLPTCELRHSQPAGRGSGSNCWGGVLPQVLPQTRSWSPWSHGPQLIPSRCYEAWWRNIIPATRPYNVILLRKYWTSKLLHSYTIHVYTFDFI